MNNLTADKPIYWAAVAQQSLYKNLTSRYVTDFSLESVVGENGKAVNKPYRSKLEAENYIPNGPGLEAQDLISNEDYLYINNYFSLLMYVDDVDKIQSKYNQVAIWTEEAGRALAERADAHIIKTGISGALNQLDDGNFGGTSGNALNLSISNIVDVYGLINEVLDNYNVPRFDRFSIITPKWYNVLWSYASGRESILGDKVLEKGIVSTYAGLEHHLTTNLPSKLVWAPTVNPANNDTITINGVVLTFKTSLGSGNGEIKIGTTLSDTLNNLVSFINNGGVGDSVNSTTHTKPSQREIQKWNAVKNGTEVNINIAGNVKPIYSSSNGSNPFSTTKSGQLILAGQKKAISAAYQLLNTDGFNGVVSVERASTVSAGKRGFNYMPLTIFGAKVFNNDRQKLVTVLIKF